LTLLILHLNFLCIRKCQRVVSGLFATVGMITSCCTAVFVLSGLLIKCVIVAVVILAPFSNAGLYIYCSLCCCLFVEVNVPHKFPTKQPILVLQSIYHTRSDDTRFLKKYTSYPYSPRWSGAEMAQRMRSVFMSMFTVVSKMLGVHLCSNIVMLCPSLYPSVYPCIQASAGLTMAQVAHLRLWARGPHNFTVIILYTYEIYQKWRQFTHIFCLKNSFNFLIWNSGNTHLLI